MGHVQWFSLPPSAGVPSFMNVHVCVNSARLLIFTFLSLRMKSPVINPYPLLPQISAQPIQRPPRDSLWFSLQTPPRPPSHPPLLSLSVGELRENQVFLTLLYDPPPYSGFLVLFVEVPRTEPGSASLTSPWSPELAAAVRGRWG